MSRSFADLALHRASVKARAQAAAAAKAARLQAQLAAKASRSAAALAARRGPAGRQATGPRGTAPRAQGAGDRSQLGDEAPEEAPAAAEEGVGGPSVEAAEDAAPAAEVVVEADVAETAEETASAAREVAEAGQAEEERADAESSGGAGGSSQEAAGAALAEGSAEEGPWWALPETEMLPLRDFVWPQGRGGPSLAGLSGSLELLMAEVADSERPSLASALAAAFDCAEEDVPQDASAFTGLCELRRRLDERPYPGRTRAKCLRIAWVLLRLAASGAASAGREQDLVWEAVYFVAVNLSSQSVSSSRLSLFGAQVLWRALRRLGRGPSTDVTPSSAVQLPPAMGADAQPSLEMLVWSLGWALRTSPQDSPGRPFLVAAAAETAGLVARAAEEAGPSCITSLDLVQHVGQVLCVALRRVSSRPLTRSGRAITDAADLDAFRKGASEMARIAELQAALRGIARLARPALCPSPSSSPLAAAVPLVFELGRTASDPALGLLASRVWTQLATCGVTSRGLWAARLLLRRAHTELGEAGGADSGGRKQALLLRLGWCHLAVDLAVCLCMFPREQCPDGFGRVARLAIGITHREAQAAAAAATASSCSRQGANSSSDLSRRFAQPLLRAVGLLTLTTGVFGPQVVQAALGADEEGQAEAASRRLVAGGLAAAWAARRSSEAGRLAVASAEEMLADALRRRPVRGCVEGALREVDPEAPGGADLLRGLLPF